MQELTQLGRHEMKQLTILTENKPGILAKVASLLGGQGVNMESITAETFADSAIIHVITSDFNTAKSLVEKNGFKTVDSEILLFEIIDRPGELGKVATYLANEGINIENIYLLSRKKDKAVLAMKLNDPVKAKQLFKNYLVEKA